MHRMSCPYTPQQNGCAERKHRHIVEMGLSLLAQSNMPLKYWQDAFTTATFLINRTPAKGIEFLSPIEKLTKQKPNYSDLKVFGCLCYPHMRPYNKHKLEFRSIAGVFLGYDTQYKGYKVLLSSGKVIVTRHIVFDEDIFPFDSKKSDDEQGEHQVPNTFISSEPTVATFPAKFCQKEKSLSPIRNNCADSPDIPSSSSSSSLQDSYDTIPLRVDLNPVGLSEDSAASSHHPTSTEIPRVINQHHMVTRGKVGVFKPKAMASAVINEEPRNVSEALNNPVWKKAMTDEYDALMRNKTWTLTTCNTLVEMLVSSLEF
ncbi:hypothetical protein CASFOL_023645 [Castilleja foliolosa]|uniref:Integrase catalytic domain-containing protein n=1 Tax=Castilleja foliolosa TaxID=1961234 RepID=A0ABD3CMW0_9LAMI